MPQAGTIALSSFLHTAGSSSGRKRSHAEITRSSSRSITPPQPPKRRRTSPHSTFRSASPSYLVDSPSPTLVRSSSGVERHGYDHRRPVMSTTNRQNSRSTATQTTIDLTADSDDSSVRSTPPPISSRRPTRRQASETSPRPPSHPTQTRAPPFSRRPPNTEPEIIDLSAESDFSFEDDEEDGGPLVFGPGDITESSDDDDEIEFVGERRAPRRMISEQAGNPRAPLVTRGGQLRILPDILRRTTQFMFGGNYGQPPLAEPSHFYVGTSSGRRNGGDTAAGESEIAIHLDYQQPAFTLGLHVHDRSSETPQVISPYKAPPAAKEGFTRTYQEESVLVCPACGDELSSGEGGIKQQVWVVKKCGHVYCGDCATNRSASKKKKVKKGQQEPPPSKSAPFTNCAVDGCGEKLSHHTAMFPLYL